MPPFPSPQAHHGPQSEVSFFCSFFFLLRVPPCLSRAPLPHREAPGMKASKRHPRLTFPPLKQRPPEQPNHTLPSLPRYT
ncbi:hypothetical protein LZ31DRAFT_550833, partial [Colletotrichum somersetense]